jgi:hypothetical protein
MPLPVFSDKIESYFILFIHPSPWAKKIITVFGPGFNWVRGAGFRQAKMVLYKEGKI